METPCINKLKIEKSKIKIKEKSLESRTISTQ
jgi:hypothetical protein